MHARMLANVSCVNSPDYYNRSHCCHIRPLIVLTQSCCSMAHAVYVCPLTPEQIEIRLQKRRATLERMRASPEYASVRYLMANPEQAPQDLEAPQSPRDWQRCSKRYWESKFRTWKLQVRAWHDFHMADLQKHASVKPSCELS